MSNSMNVIISNVVNKEKLRKVQTKVLDELAGYLKTSFGPYGSNSIIKAGQEAATIYTKDGHDILSKIKYNGPIESTIIDDIVEVTRHVVKTVGDGTTSAVEMSNAIFKGLIKLEKEKKYSAYSIIFAFKRVVDTIIAAIKMRGKPCTLEDIYDIAFTSTNGNEKLANNIYTLYKDYGMDIFIDLQVAVSSEEDIIKIYDGMTLDNGYTDSVFANKENAVCEIVNPKVYVFDDPVDTAEMIMLLDTIVMNNIIMPYNPDPNVNKGKAPVPTVILAPRISRDMSATMDKLANFIMQFPMVNKPPICVITAYNNQDTMSDIATLCGVKRIKKYIDLDVQKTDIEKGLAPTPDNVCDFGGSCEMISVTKDSAKFIRPKDMYNEDDSYTETFKNLLGWCEAELKRLQTENNTITTEIYKLKRRINSLKANLIEYFVGGISIADRDNDRALLEDAIKNCRSAVQNGVGYGANIEGFKSCEDTRFMYEKDTLEYEIMEIVFQAYHEVVELLYSQEDDPNKVAEQCLGMGPFNLRTRKFDKKVKSSIMTDVAVLEAIAKIVSLMATSEQFILPSPAFNTYDNIDA